MQEKIREVLSGVIDPNTGKDLVSSKALYKPHHFITVS